MILYSASNDHMTRPRAAFTSMGTDRRAIILKCQDLNLSQDQGAIHN